MSLRDQVYTQAALLAGDLTHHQMEALEALCTAGTAALTARLRDGLTPEDCKADFVAAASLMALAALDGLDEDRSVEQISAGDLTIRKGSRAAAANCLRTQAELMMAYMRDGFLFQGCDMRGVVERMMNKYGTAVRLCRNGEEWPIRAFFQSVRSKSWDLSESEYSPLGEIPRGRHIYIGPVEPEAAAGDTVWVEDKAYLVRRSEIIRDGSGPVYCWGLCLEKGGEDNWGTIVSRVIEGLRSLDIRADEAYPGGRIPALTGPVAAVRLGKVDRSVRTTTVQVIVMSPAAQGGGSCEATALRAIEALEDMDGVCVKGLCQFDDMADVFHIEITAEFFGVALENDWAAGPGYAVTIGSQPMEWVTGFSIRRQTDEEITSISNAVWEFTMEELLGPGSVDPPDPTEPFAITLARDNGEETFTGCVWTSVKRTDTLRGISQVRTGTAKKRMTSGIL